MLCVATGLFGLFFFLTLFIQTVLGYSAIRSGIAYLPFAIGVVIASALASQLVPRIGPRPLIVAGCASEARHNHLGEGHRAPGQGRRLAPGRPPGT
jgi:predicted MFS family arabinose efflux permease